MLVNSQPFEKQNWFNKLNFTQKELIKQSFYLLGWAKNNREQLFDYSFVVMPAAKAYEGFLKDWLFNLKLIDQYQLKDDRFRIGKALNPYLEHVPYLKKECLYEEITQKCGPELAKTLWETWKQSRNRIFHYFHHLKQAFSFSEAEERLNQIVETIKVSSSKV